MFRKEHQMKLVVKPPNNTTTSLGRPLQRTVVPAAREASPIGLPAVSANEKQALMIPEKVATRIPLVKLNSAMDFFFSSSGISFSFVNPAIAATTMPSKQISTPNKVTLPGVVDAICPMVSATGMVGMKVLKIGGSSVPNAAQ